MHETRIRLLLGVVLAIATCTPERPARLTVTVVGIDGATWRVMEPMLARGDLPNVARLRARGVWGPLRSQAPLVSPAVWTTVATGVSRKHHGIERFEDKRRSLVSSRERRVPALWTIASRAHLSTAVIGWWATYPAEHVNGVMISERALKTRDADVRPMLRGVLPAPQAGLLAYPPDALRALHGAFDSAASPVGEDEPSRVARTMRIEDRAVVDALLNLREKRGPFDLEMILLRGVDPVSHFFWRYYEPNAPIYRQDQRPNATEIATLGHTIEDHYRYVDGLLGTLLTDRWPETQIVILVSDHGFEAGYQPFHRGELSGTHVTEAAMYGIIVASGGPFRRGAPVEGASVLDVAPTVLHLLGSPVAQRLEGRVLTETLTDEWYVEHPVRMVAAYEGPPVILPGADGEAEARPGPVDDRLKQELRSLGYVE